jgi:conjugative transposon TraM protein
MKPHSENFIRKRRFLMVLPLLVTPFITMTFWALGGGKGAPAKAENPTQGLNVSLPDAQFSNKETWDKLNLYEMAKRDSNKFEEARENDPYFDLITFKTQKDKNSQEDSSAGKLINAFPHKDKLGLDPNEERVNKKLEELFREVNKSTESQHDPSPPKHSSGFTSSSQHDPQFTQDVDRLGQMMEMMKDSPEADPEMQQIESVLEKILDIQHPDRVKGKLQAFSDKKKANALPVTAVEANDNIALLGARENPSVMMMDTTAFLQLLSSQSTSNGFFGLDDEVTVDEGIANGIRAVIHDTQELVDGATVKMRLVDAVTIQGRNISAGQFLFGTCAINGERLTIEINSVRDGNALLPVALSVFDLDGLEGIYIPGAITRDAAKQASGNALQNVQLMSLDPSIGAQAAAAGVEAAKGLLGKKAKLIKVTVKAGYQILLKDNNTATR